MKKIVVKSGVKPWPKIFHNLRSSRQTELTEQFGIKAACSWLGNSIRVADTSYLQVPDSLWDAATESALLSALPEPISNKTGNT
ncbi:hypothetical protein [Thalassoglobus neptunius]|nr:hypothetical protein [Thalassoglobus neptunius]